jgi:hypothetical protein
MKLRRHRKFLLAARPLWAVVETAVLSELFVVALLALRPHLPTRVVSQGLLFITGFTALWCALRMRLSPASGLLTRAWHEALAALVPPAQAHRADVSGLMADHGYPHMGGFAVAQLRDCQRYGHHCYGGRRCLVSKCLE